MKIFNVSMPKQVAIFQGMDKEENSGTHQVSLEETDVLASFDVVSLFTRVPVDEPSWSSPTACSRMTL